ncbi:MAG TPA: putative zinc-binding protein [Candidatus Deferrimicrobium sp.]|nr:putative zinc-binding protein [Candidatus Deferrimicrobium sp.]
MHNKIAVVACTGMGKALASIGRYASIYLTTTLLPEKTINVCFPCVVSEDDASVELLKKYPVILIDGCSETCGKKILTKLNSNIIGHLKVWQILGKNKELIPDSRVNIGEKGIKLAKIVAQEASKIINQYLEK